MVFSEFCFYNNNNDHYNDDNNYHDKYRDNGIGSDSKSDIHSHNHSDSDSDSDSNSNTLIHHDNLTLQLLFYTGFSELLSLHIGIKLDSARVSLCLCEFKLERDCNRRFKSTQRAY